MVATIQGRADATATLLIAADPNVPLKPKPEYREEFEIAKERYDELPPVFTLTELPQPAVVAVDCIKNHDQHLASFPKDEQDDFNLNVDGRWERREAVQRFINRALELSFGGEHFQAVEGSDHINVDIFYLEVPSYSFCIGDVDGQAIDFYSAPGVFAQPFSIQARVNVTCPAAVAGF